jgi:hypothetical protein
MICVYQLGVFMVSAVCFFLRCGGKRNVTQLRAMQVILEQNFILSLLCLQTPVSRTQIPSSTLAEFRANLRSSENRDIGETA